MTGDPEKRRSWGFLGAMGMRLRCPDRRVLELPPSGGVFLSCEGLWNSDAVDHPSARLCFLLQQKPGWALLSVEGPGIALVDAPDHQRSPSAFGWTHRGSVASGDGPVRLEVGERFYLMESGADCAFILEEPSGVDFGEAPERKKPRKAGLGEDRGKEVPGYGGTNKQQQQQQQVHDCPFGLFHVRSSLVELRFKR